MYFIRIKLSLISYKRTVQSHEDTSRNCAEFGANLTADIPSSGALFSFVSLISLLIPTKTFKTMWQNVLIPCNQSSSNTELVIIFLNITITPISIWAIKEDSRRDKESVYGLLQRNTNKWWHKQMVPSDNRCPPRLHSFTTVVCNCHWLGDA